MNRLALILYGRKGCCLCESLESKLRSISLKEIQPPLEFFYIDIDTSDISESDRIRFQLEVPLLFLKPLNDKEMIELPRASPRLNEDDLSSWLQKIITKKIQNFQMFNPKINSYEY